MTETPADDPILAMLDSLEEAISQDAQLPAPRDRDVAPTEDRPVAARAPVTALRRHPDPPPKSPGVGPRVQGTTSHVLSAFKWGT